MPRYICTEKCFHMGKIWVLSEVAEFTENELPRSSRKVTKEGKVIDEGGRIRHFRLLEEGRPMSKAEVETGVEVRVNETKTVRKEPR